MEQQKAAKLVYEKFRNLELKLWFRLIKVAYVSVVLATLFIGMTILWQSKPYLTFDNEKSYVKCDRDKDTQWIYILDKNLWGLYGEFDQNRTLDSYVIKEVREACSRDRDTVTGETKPIPFGEIVEYSKSNYELVLFSKFQGSYSKWMRDIFVFLAILIVVHKVLTQAFYYIVTGKRMFRGIAYYQPIDEGDDEEDLDEYFNDTPDNR